jgi:hypothetical protein
MMLFMLVQTQGAALGACPIATCMHYNVGGYIAAGLAQLDWTHKVQSDNIISIHSLSVLLSVPAIVCPLSYCPFAYAHAFAYTHIIAVSPPIE